MILSRTHIVGHLLYSRRKQKDRWVFIAMAKAFLIFMVRVVITYQVLYPHFVDEDVDLRG